MTPRPMPTYSLSLPFAVEALDEPDHVYAPTLATLVTKACHEAQAAGAPQPLNRVWLGPKPPAAWSAHDDGWREISVTAAQWNQGELPQPPGRIADVVVLAWLTAQTHNLGATLGFVLRMLRDDSRSSRVVLLDRVKSPVGKFVTELETIAPRRPLPFTDRLAAHRLWSPYDAEDWHDLLRTFGLEITQAQVIGDGRRYLVAVATPLTATHAK